MSFEQFLAEADRESTSDPGTAMVNVLTRNPVRGVNLSHILSTRGLDPRNNPSNLLPFLRRIASDGQWGVNLTVNVR